MSEGLWRRRRARAIELLSSVPHADEMLEFYVGLVELQESVAQEVARAPKSFGIQGMQGQSLRLEELSPDAMEPAFADFLRAMEPIGTQVMASATRALLEAGADERAQVLRTFWLERDPGDFLQRAFSEAVAWVISRGQAPGAGRDTALRRSCPVCDSPPQVGVLRDDPGALGRRLLVCTLCATEWPFPRLTCAHCGSVDADGLHVHQVESVPHVRIEACDSCAGYLKAVDLRKLGGAEPVVDDLATPELDLWASDRGLVKIQANLLGL